MFLGAISLATSGRWSTKKDLPRYQYQKILYERANGPNSWEKGHLFYQQKEVHMQCAANYLVLVLPCALVCQSKSEKTTPLEIFAFFLWISSMIFESVADIQKLKFA